MALYVLNKKDYCLCGSGKKYKHCCLNYVDLSIDDFFSEVDKGNYQAAYNIINSELTKYLVNVKRHTVPMLNNNEKMALRILEVDNDAVGELLDRILFILNKVNIKVNFS